MISLPTHSIATGISARIRRSATMANVSAGLARQTMTRKGGMFFSAAQRAA